MSNPLFDPTVPPLPDDANWRNTPLYDALVAELGDPAPVTP
jgi:hypothetical protein